MDVYEALQARERRPGYFPNSDLRIVRRGPALIVQDENVPVDHPQRVVACITSRTHRLGPTRL